MLRPEKKTTALMKVMVYQLPKRKKLVWDSFLDILSPGKAHILAEIHRHLIGYNMYFWSLQKSVTSVLEANGS